MNPAEARLCVINKIHVIFLAIRLKFVIKSSSQIFDYTMDAGRIGNMKLDLTPVSHYPLTDLTDLLNLSFENYLVPIQFNISQFITMLRKDSIDLDSSRVLIIDDEPAGIALIARRGW